MVQNPDETQLRKIQNAQYKLLEAISESLGYKDKVTIVPKEQKNTEGQK